MKRILIFSLNYYPHFIGGAEVAIKEITDRIDPSDVEFHMVTLRMDRTLLKEERIGNVVVHRIGPSVPNPSIADLKRFPLHYAKHLYQFLAAVHAARLHRKYRFDGVWAMMAHACGIPAGLFKTFHPRVPYLLTLQEGDPLDHIERIARPVWPLFVRGFTKADYLQPISHFLEAWGMRMGFKGHTEVIPNGVDGVRFSEKVSAKKESNNVVLVTTSRLVHKNGIDTVIRALALLPEHISFSVYGIGPDEDMLRALAAELGVSERVRFMGQAAHADLPRILQEADIFIRPSRSEGMGNSFIEAMAAGLPVVATQEGGIADFLFDAERNPDQKPTGWAVDVDAPEQIVRAVEDILENPENTKETVATAQVLALSAYDWNDIALRMQKLFKRMRGGVE